LFSDPNPDGDKTKDFIDYINPNSFQETEAFVEPSLRGTPPSERFQFQRLGYFVTDLDTTKDHLVFNKTVGLRDTWSKKSS
jgi:glutaminyl-tRNA synthetase